MSYNHNYRSDPRIREALDDLRSAVAQHYPDAVFSEYEGADPCGMYLRAVVDLDDTDEVIDRVVGLMTEIQADRELPVYLVVEPTAERIQAQLRAYRPGPPLNLVSILIDATP